MKFLRITISFLFISALVDAQTPLTTSRLVKLLQEQHISPPLLDDSLSARWLKTFIDDLDPDKKILTAPEITELEAFKTSLDDELKNSGTTFLKKVIPIYRGALHRSLQFLKQPIAFNWSTSDQYVDASTTSFPGNVTAHQIRWQQYLQAEVLTMAWSEALLDSVSFDLKFVQSKEKELLARVITVETQNLLRILEHPIGFERYLESIYLKSHAAVYDPHSTLLPGNEYRHYMEALSSVSYSFGVVIEETSGGNIRIEQVVPGGAAWRSGRIHAGDVLVEIRNNQNRIYSFVGVGIDHASELLDEIPVEVVHFAIRKEDGALDVVPLRKEKTNNDENIVSSFVLEQYGKKIGYISLPGFYTAELSDEGSECANDVAKEIIKLKRDGIEGLIFDLRYNGGGSMQEAIALAGIFIHEGPIVLAQTRTRTLTLKDMNRGTVYDGPLLVLVNHQSASASEVVAAALQDYQRAIIAGTPTFGKATGQQILPVDPLPANPQAATKAVADGKISFAKVTVSKLFRITGRTHQGIGVMPDILLPDLFDELAFGEQTLPGTLTANPIEARLPYAQYPQMPLTKIEAMSRARIAGNERFHEIKELNAWLIQELERTTTPLGIENFKRIAEPQRKLFSQYSRSYQNGFSVSTKSFDQGREAMDEFYKLSNANFMRNLQTDVALEEAFFILCDYINLLNK